MELLSYFIWSAGLFTYRERDHAGAAKQAASGSHNFVV